MLHSIVAVVFRIRAPDFAGAKEEIRVFLQDGLAKHPMPIQFKFLGEKDD